MALVSVEIATRPQEQRDTINARMTKVLIQNGSTSDNVQVLAYRAPARLLGWGQQYLRQILGYR